MAQQFSKDDHVQEKSGGPIMTVTAVVRSASGRKIYCVWFDNPFMRPRDRLRRMSLSKSRKLVLLNRTLFEQIIAEFEKDKNARNYI